MASSSQNEYAPLEKIVFTGDHYKGTGGIVFSSYLVDENRDRGEIRRSYVCDRYINQPKDYRYRSCGRVSECALFRFLTVLKNGDQMEIKQFLMTLENRDQPENKDMYKHYLAYTLFLFRSAKTIIFKQPKASIGVIFQDKNDYEFSRNDVLPNILKYITTHLVKEDVDDQQIFKRLIFNGVMFANLRQARVHIQMEFVKDKDTFHHIASEI